MPMKKILYIHQYFNTPKDAGGIRSYEFAKRLVRDGYDVEIITTRRKGDKFSGINSTIIDGIKIKSFYIPYSNEMKISTRIISFLKFLLYASLYIRKTKSDIVFATSTPITVFIPAYLHKLIYKSELIFEVRDLWPEMPIAAGVLKNNIIINVLKKFELFCYNNSSKVVALSPGMEAHINKVSNVKTRMISNSSDLEYFNKEQNKDKEISANKIVYIGKHGFLNGLHYLVDLAAELKKINSKIKIEIYGYGSQTANIINKIESMNLSAENISVEGPISKVECSNVLNEAFMCACIFEDIKEMEKNSANKFFDGLAAGKPMLINYGGWHHELINSYKCGISSYKKTLNDFAHEVNELSNNEELVTQMSQNSLKLAKTKFDRDILYKKLIDFIEVKYDNT